MDFLKIIGLDENEIAEGMGSQLFHLDIHQLIVFMWVAFVCFSMIYIL